MSNLKNYLFTSESVSEGHPDKVSDRISDMVVDTYLSKDPFSRVACETLTTTNKVVLAGEVRGPEIKKDELIHIGIITSHGEGKDTLVEKVIQPLVPCGVASSGQMTTIPGLVGAMSGDDLGSVDVGLLPKMNNERLALSEFQLWKDTVFGEMLGAMANGYVQLTKGKLDIRKPTCVNILMLGNPPHNYTEGKSSKREMMEAFGRYTPQIISRLTLIYTQLKLSEENKQDLVDEIIIKNMDDYGSIKTDLKMWQAFFREYLRFVSKLPVKVFDSYGLVKTVFETLKKKQEFQDAFHARGMPDNRKWAEFANLCRSFSRLNGRTQITNDDIRESYSAVLHSLKTLSAHFDLKDLNLDLSPLLRSIYLEVKERGAIDAATLSQVLKIKLSTVMSCLEELKGKNYLQRQHLHRWCSQASLSYSIRIFKYHWLSLRRITANRKSN